MTFEWLAGQLCWQARHLVFAGSAWRGAADSSRPAMEHSGVLTEPSRRFVAQGRLGSRDPSGWGMRMERMRVGILSMASWRVLSVKPTTCSMPSSSRMKQSSHLHPTKTECPCMTPTIPWLAAVHIINTNTDYQSAGG